MNNNDGLKLSYLMESWRIKLASAELSDTYVRAEGANASQDVGAPLGKGERVSFRG